MTELRLTSPPSKTTYSTGEPLDLSGCTISVVYSDGSTEFVGNNSISYAGYDNQTVGSQLVALEYGGKSVIVSITVLESQISDIVTTLTDYNKRWFIGDKISQSDLNVTVRHTNGTSEKIKEYVIENPDITRQGSNTITVTTMGYKSQIVVDAREDAISMLSVLEPEQVQFIVGEEFNSKGIKVLAVYASGKETDITEECTISPPQLNVPGKTYVDVSYKEVKATYPIEIIKPEYESMDISQWETDRIVLLKFKNRDTSIPVDAKYVREITDKNSNAKTLLVAFGDQTYTYTEAAPAPTTRYVGSCRVSITVPTGIDLISNKIGTASAHSNVSTKLHVSSTKENMDIVALPLSVNLKKDSSTEIVFSLVDGVSSTGYVCLDSELEVLK